MTTPRTLLFTSFLFLFLCSLSVYSKGIFDDLIKDIGKTAGDAFEESMKEAEDKKKGLVALKLLWSEKRQDNYVTTTSSEGKAMYDGYKKVRVEGLMLIKQAVGTLPLKTYYNAKFDDYTVVATPEMEEQVKQDGYKLIRTEGYVFPVELPGTIPLKLYWNQERTDFHPAAAEQSIRDAEANNYKFLRIEGYLLRESGIPIPTVPKDAVPAVQPTNFTVITTPETPTVPEPVNTGTATVIPLKLYWNNNKQDNYTTTASGEESAKKDGYGEFRIEGYILARPFSGAAALKTYYSAKNEDYVSVATAKMETQVKQEGYTYVRTEGFIYSTQQPGTTPLKLYWNKDRTDYQAAASKEGLNDAEHWDYKLVSTEGYVLIEAKVATQPESIIPAVENITSTPLKLFWNRDKQDNYTTTASGEESAKKAGYGEFRIEGYLLARPFSGAAALKTYYSAKNEDYVSVATAQMEAQVKQEGYTYVRTEGFMYSTQQPGTTPLKLYWNKDRTDYQAVASKDGLYDAERWDYKLVSTEGYVLIEVKVTTQPETAIPAVENITSTPLKLFWNGDKQDNYTTTASGEESAKKDGYGEFRIEGYILARPFSGAAALKTYYSAKNEDYVSVATAQMEAQVKQEGYTYVRTEGFVYTTQQPATTPLKLFWNKDRTDYQSAASKDGINDADVWGYKLVNTEGYILTEAKTVTAETTVIATNPNTTPNTTTTVTPANPTNPPTNTDIKPPVTSVNQNDTAKVYYDNDNEQAIYDMLAALRQACDKKDIDKTCSYFDISIRSKIKGFLDKNPDQIKILADALKDAKITDINAERLTDRSAELKSGTGDKTIYIQLTRNGEGWFIKSL